MSDWLCYTSRHRYETSIGISHDTGHNPSCYYGRISPSFTKRHPQQPSGPCETSPNVDLFRVMVVERRQFWIVGDNVEGYCRVCVSLVGMINRDFSYYGERFERAATALKCPGPDAIVTGLEFVLRLRRTAICVPGHIPPPVCVGHDRQCSAESKTNSRTPRML